MFKRTIHLALFQGLPFSKTINFDEPDPSSVLHTRPLDIAGRNLRAQIDARPKAKAYGIEIDADPPAPGLYVFLLIYAGIEHELEVNLLPGEFAKDLQAKIIDAIKGLLLGLSVCAATCSNVFKTIVAAPWPGLEWSLALVSEPGEDVVVLLLQDNTPLAEFTVTSEVVGDFLAVTIVLTHAQTGGIPAAGDGPYRWRLTAPMAGEGDNLDDQLLLAHGLVTIGRP